MNGQSYIFVTMSISKNNFVLWLEGVDVNRGLSKSSSTAKFTRRLFIEYKPRLSCGVSDPDFEV